MAFSKLRSYIKRVIQHPMTTLSIAIIAVIAAAVEVDIFVPSLPEMREYFDTTASGIQQILSINFIGLCVASIFYGPLADAYGRKPVLLFGLLVFTIGSMGCALSEQFHVMLTWRFIQGLGSSAGFVIPGAVIYDLFTRQQAAKILGIYNSIITLTMAGAPIIGSYLYLTYSWHANFWLISALAGLTFILCLVGLQESLAVEKRQPLVLKSIAKAYWQLCTTAKTMGFLLIICLLFAAYMIYVSNLSLIFVEHLQVSEKYFPFYQMTVLVSFAFGSIISGRMIARFGENKILSVGNIVSGIGVCFLLLVAFVYPSNTVLITVAMSLFAVGFALMINLVFGFYMEHFVDIKGIASALCNSVRLLAVAGAIGLSAALFDGTIMPVAALIFIFTLISFIILVVLLAKREAHLDDESVEVEEQAQ